MLVLKDCEERAGGCCEEEEEVEVDCEAGVRLGAIVVGGGSVRSGRLDESDGEVGGGGAVGWWSGIG